MQSIKRSASIGGSSVAARGSAYSWYVCGVVTLIYAFSYMDRGLLSVMVVPIEHELGITDTTFGLLQGAAYAVFYCLFMIPLARVADRSNRRNLLLLSVSIWCTATVCSGLARTVPELFAARIATAIGEATVFPCAVSILSDYFEPRRRTRAISLWSIGLYLGAALALGGGGAILKILGHSGHGLPVTGALSPWRWVFIAMGGLGFCFIPLLLTVKEPVRRNDTGEAADSPYTLRQVLSVFKNKRHALAAVIVGFASYSAAGQSIQAWAPTMFVRAHGWLPANSGLWLGLITLTFGPVGAIVGSVLADLTARRRGGDAKVVVSGSAAAICVLTGITLTFPAVSVALASYAALNFLVGAGFGLAQAALAEIVPNRMRAQAAGLYSLCVQLFAATVGPLMVGVLNDHVFHDPSQIALSMRIAPPLAFLIAACALLGGRAAVGRAHVVPAFEIRSAEIGK